MKSLVILFSLLVVYLGVAYFTKIYPFQHGKLQFSAGPPVWTMNTGLRVPARDMDKPYLCDSDPTICSDRDLTCVGLVRSGPDRKTCMAYRPDYKPNLITISKSN